MTMSVQHFVTLTSSALVVSLSVGTTLLLTKRSHARYTSDPMSGVQKLHTEVTPRVGGIAIYLGVLAAYLVTLVLNLQLAKLLSTVVLAGIPCWLMGLCEDLTKRVRPAWRLLAIALSALIACLLTGVSITRLDILGLDQLLQLAPVSILFTVFAIAGLSNSVNLIDGMNGLASFVVCIAFIALGGIALEEGDIAIARLCVVMCAALLGFMLFNWPRGLIFLGDGGSYFLGFVLAWVCVLLTQRVASVSAFSMLTICIYPVMETLFSILRRTLRGFSMARPDRLHLHSLFLQRVVRHPHSFLNRQLRALFGKDLSQSAQWASNAATGMILALLSVPPALCSYWWHHRHLLSVFLCLLFALGYITLFARMVSFKWRSPVSFLLARPCQRVMRARKLRRQCQSMHSTRKRCDLA
ncbi:MAG: MraY family glycosyltransferase [Limnohabitans sp.]